MSVPDEILTYLAALPADEWDDLVSRTRPPEQHTDPRVRGAALDELFVERIAAMGDDEFAELAARARPPVDARTRAAAALRGLRGGLVAAPPDAGQPTEASGGKAAAAAALRRQRAQR